MQNMEHIALLRQEWEHVDSVRCAHVFNWMSLYCMACSYHMLVENHNEYVRGAWYREKPDRCLSDTDARMFTYNPRRRRRREV